MAKTSKSAWTAFERDIAAAWDGALDDPDCIVKRNALSGANSRNDDGTPRPGDVTLPRSFNLLIEAKFRSSHAHHKLFREAKADAAKHGRDHALLYTRVKHERGYLVVMDAELFHQMIAIPQIQEILKRDKHSVTPIRRSRATSAKKETTQDHNQDEQGNIGQDQGSTKRTRRPRRTAKELSRSDDGSGPRDDRPSDLHP